MGKVIGILSLKGGVGKTSSVVSLGAALADFGKKVLLVDANFSAPNLGFHLDIIDPETTIHHVLGGKANLSEAIHDFDNFHVVPASVFPSLAIDPLKLKKKIETLKDAYDFILIDSSPALNVETLATMLSSDELLVVSTPDYSTLGMTMKAIKVAKKKGTPISGLILNKVYNKNFELSLEEIERTSEVPVLAVIPHDINVLKAQSNFMPLTHFKPKSDVGLEYMKLAACLTGDKFKTFRFKDIFKDISPGREEINRDLFYTSSFN